MLRIVYPPHDGFFLFRNVVVALTIEAQQPGIVHVHAALRCVECTVNDEPIGRVCGKSRFSLSFDANMTGPVAAVTAELYEERDGAVELRDAASASFRLVDSENASPDSQVDGIAQGSLVDCDLGPFEGALYLQGFAGRHAGRCERAALGSTP